MMLSVLIPSYNVSSKISACFASLDELKAAIPETEVVFVDDASSDDTFAKIGDFASTRPWVKATRLSKNSGTPSVPRNKALTMATGEYVFHLDPDDEILPSGVLAELEVAKRTRADLVRAPLIRDNGRERVVMNRIEGWEQTKTQEERVARIVREHSTTVCSLYRREFLEKNGLTWPEDLRLAEDAIYLYRALELGRVEYADEPDFVYNVQLDSGVASSTQQYEDRELLNHVSAWQQSTEILGRVGIDYFGLRGQMALSAAIQNMIRFNKGGFNRSSFDLMADFLSVHEKAVRNFTYGPRFKEICNLLLDRNYEAFLEKIKIRLLIAGYDLRFILPAVPELEDFYQIQIDEWTGHETHDLEQSKRLRDWADAIHCEWMLGNAVWYSENKNPRQSLTVRLHRFETGKDYGNQINQDALDRVITIAPGMFEETQRSFSFDREKVAYVPNYIEVGKYERSRDPEKVFNLVMVGSVPIRKGYRRALELLQSLREVDDRYNLTVFGRRPDELGWVYNDPAERAYFVECERFVRTNGLESVVKFEGWVDTTVALADKGFILSLSDAEGSHVAAAEGFASGNITLLRPWAGAEYMYPNQYIFDSLAKMRNYILECRDFTDFERRRRAGDEYVQTHYSMERFKQLYRQTIPVPYSVP